MLLQLWGLKGLPNVVWIVLIEVHFFFFFSQEILKTPALDESSRIIHENWGLFQQSFLFPYRLFQCHLWSCPLLYSHLPSLFQISPLLQQACCLGPVLSRLCWVEVSGEGLGEREGEKKRSGYPAVSGPYTCWCIPILGWTCFAPSQPPVPKLLLNGDTRRKTGLGNRWLGGRKIKDGFAASGSAVCWFTFLRAPCTRDLWSAAGLLRGVPERTWSSLWKFWCLSARWMNGLAWGLCRGSERNEFWLSNPVADLCSKPVRSKDECLSCWGDTERPWKGSEIPVTLGNAHRFCWGKPTPSHN